MDALAAAYQIAGSGLETQSTRLRIIAENLANAQSTGKTPGSDPYKRKTVSFASELDRVSGVVLVRANAFGVDPTPFNVEHDPGNPAADENGNVKLPNVNSLIEISDMREANRAYEANLQVLKQAGDLIGMTINLLRANS